MREGIMQQDVVERVLKAAGVREKPPAEIERAVRESLRQEWLAIVAEERTRRRWRTMGALAAGLATAALGVWLTVSQLSGPGRTIATVAAVSGEVSVRSGWRPPGAVRAGDALRESQVVTSEATGLGALSLDDGISVRFDRGTRVRLAAADRIEIERGAIYVDSGADAPAARTLEVVTPAGVVTHVGTQFEVKLTAGSVRLRVREGRVEWRSHSGRTERADVGEQLLIGSNGVVDRQSAPTYGESWDWVAAAAPGIGIDGLPLAEFLAWAGRELGREVAYESPALASEAARITLRGSIAGLTPDQALDAVLGTTSLRAEIRGGRIAVSQADAGS
jgi:ferric-dicitrate binding protein FerR (iron transport regulator)